MRNPNNKKPLALAKSYKATDVIDEIQKCIKTMKKNWDIIRNNNVIDKGLTPNFDLKKVYENNVQLENRIIDLKLISLCINLGFKSINDIPKESSFPTIYVLSQLKSRIQNLKTVTYKFDNKIENIIFTRKFINDEILLLNKEIIKCELELTKFNEQTNLVA